MHLRVKSVKKSFTQTDAIIPISQPSQRVNSPRKIMLWGVFLLMEGTHTRAIMRMREKAMAT